MRAVVLSAALLWQGVAWGDSIFNLPQPSAPTPAGRGERGAQVVVPSAAPTAGAGVAPPRGTPALSGGLLDAKALKQYEQLPGEGTEAYLARLRALAQRSIDDVERASAAHNARMRALAPKR